MFLKSFPLLNKITYRPFVRQKGDKPKSIGLSPFLSANLFYLQVRQPGSVKQYFGNN
jgi:hypothetical protein